MLNRRQFLSIAAASTTIRPCIARPDALDRFELGVITDEVDRDLARALKFVREFDLKWIELRHVWDAYIMNFSKEQTVRAREMIDDQGLQVSCICTPFLKSQFPGSTPIRDNYPETTLDHQFENLKKAIDIAHAFDCKNIRTFSFARCRNSEDLFQAAADNIAKGAEMAAEQGLRLVLENIYDGTICTGEECARICEAVPNRSFGLIWDPPNAYGLAGVQPYPGMYEKLDTSRIYHVHLKDAVWKGDHHKWAVVGEGELDLMGQLRAFLRDQVNCTISLETHANLNGNREAASRAGMPVLIEMMREA